MIVTFLGTNGWYDTATGNTVCILLRTADHDIIFDAGNGLSKVDECYTGKTARTGFLLLSHFHLDHVQGLHTLNKLRSFSRLMIAGPAGSRSVLNTLVNSPFTAPLNTLSYPVSVLELPEDAAALPFKIEALPLNHAGLALGYRIEAEGKMVAYCTDTGYCENAVRLGRNADLLITECAYRSGEEDPDWPHLNPETAARIAQEAMAKKLVLTHFDASRYKTVAARNEALIAARSRFPSTFNAADGLSITV
jgi:ribonuclease BN (tRNA processing enzyme)